MATPATIDDLMKLIRKSGMIDENKLNSYLEHLTASNSLPTEVKKLAGSMVRDGILTYFQAEQFLLGKWRGFTIGKYKLLERIGFGGMGQVFLCEHIYMKRRVAIKVLPPAKAEDPAALGRFYREARAAAAVDHPNIVRTHDIDQDGNLHFLVMEYVDGSSFLEIIKKTGPMDYHRAVHYIWQSCLGLDHAFRVGVIHRDIKPGNILVDRFGVSKILDMGLARFYHTDDDMLTLKYDEKSVLGTADYVAPEQTVNSHDVDVRADIYSLGATFYYLLAGHPPFPDGTIAQKLLAHQTREPAPIRTIRSEIPEELQAVLQKMMAKRLEDRFQTPGDVYEALLPFVQPSIAPPPIEEMPMLSPAAREALVAESTSAGISEALNSASGSFRQDSAILRAEMMTRSGRLGSNSSIRPMHAGIGGGDSVSSIRSGQSSSIRKQFFDPPQNTPLSGTFAPARYPVPQEAETNINAPLGQHTPSNHAPRVPMQITTPAPQQSLPLLEGSKKSAVMRIFMEALIVFGLACVLLLIGFKVIFPMFK